MLRTRSLILLFSLFAARITAQVSFQKTYGDVRFDDAQAVVRTADGGYCLAGNTGEALPDSGDIVLYRLNADGDLLWSVKLGGPKDDFVSDLLLTPDGGYLLTGITYGSPGDTAYSDLFAAQLDDVGMVRWARAYGGADYDEAAAVCSDGNGGYILAGNTSSFGSALRSACILRIDSLGHPVDGSVVATTLSNFYLDIEALPPASGGGFVAAGGTFNLSGGTNFDHYITLFDANASVRMIRRYGSASADWTYSIKPDAQSGFVACGVSTGYGAGGVDQAVYRIDNAGLLTWSRHFGSAESDRATDLFTDSATGNTFVCGMTNIGDSLQPIQQATMIALDASGHRLFDYRYGDLNASSEAYRILAGNDGFALCGYTVGFSDSLGDAYLIKTDQSGSSGCFESPVNFSQNTALYSDSIGGNAQSVNMNEWTLGWTSAPFVNQFFQVCYSSGLEMVAGNKIRLYPNPAGEKVQMTCSSGQPFRWSIRDGLGKLIREGESLTDAATLSLSGIMPGLYFLHWESGNTAGCSRLLHF